MGADMKRKGKTVAAERPLVYLVDDDLELCSALVRFLGHDSYEVLTFQRGADALMALPNDPPDLVILSTTLQGQSCYPVLEAMREQSDCPVLLTSTSPDEADCIQGLERGGDDYLVKPFSARELVARLKALSRRVRRQEASGGPKPLKELSYRDLLLDLDTKTLSYGASRVSLTFSELFILKRMMTAPTRAFSRDELLEAPVRQFGGGSRAVDMHIGNLRKKIAELGANFDILQPVRGLGYRFEP